MPLEPGEDIPTRESPALANSLRSTDVFGDSLSPYSTPGLARSDMLEL